MDRPFPILHINLTDVWGRNGIEGPIRTVEKGEKVEEEEEEV
jgi:hypothetical protein